LGHSPERRTIVNTLLIGYRASGKSSIGRLLARRLRLRFVDLDDCTLGSFTVPSIQEVWRLHGEGAWRSAEVAALRNAMRRDHQVIALGGGTPMIREARQLIQSAQGNAQARVIYLQCDPAIIARRLRETPADRPSLTGADPADEADIVLKKRDLTYRGIADVIYDTTQTTPDQAAADIAATLSKLH
jgi:shikimate kinase